MRWPQWIRAAGSRPGPMPTRGRVGGDVAGHLWAQIDPGLVVAQGELLGEARAQVRRLREDGRCVGHVDGFREERGTLWLSVGGLELRVACADPDDGAQVAAAGRLADLWLRVLIAGDDGCPVLVLTAGEWTLYVPVLAVHASALI